MSDEKGLGTEDRVRLARAMVEKGLTWEEAMRRAINYEPNSFYAEYRRKLEAEREAGRARKRKIKEMFQGPPGSLDVFS